MYKSCTVRGMQKYLMRPKGWTGEQERLAETLPQYLTREEAAQLCNVSPRTVDRWRRWWDESKHQHGLKTYFRRVAVSETPPGDPVVAKQQLLDRIGWTPATQEQTDKPGTPTGRSARILGV